MPTNHVFPLESIRTDGWFERIGEGIGSFQTLCEVIGPKFFAFAMIAGARIVALTIDRRNPDNTQVDFVVAGDEAEMVEATPSKLTLGEFRKRLVIALVTEEPTGPAPARLMDVEAIQRHIGVRYLLLAPIFGYGLVSLTCDTYGSMLRVRRDGIDEIYEIEEFRTRIRVHVREELQRALRGARGAIDLAKVTEAEAAAEAGDQLRIVELLGSWPAPLALFLRTSEGQALTSEVRMRISRALALLGQACILLGEADKGQEILRLAIQYAGDTSMAPEVFTILGCSMLGEKRFAEAIGVLKRAANLGADGKKLWPLIADAFAQRGFWAPAVAALLRAKRLGAEGPEVDNLYERATQNLGPTFVAWQHRINPS
jgi:tetratricopeptide (TPR) repeat protein